MWTFCRQEVDRSKGSYWVDVCCELKHRESHVVKSLLADQVSKPVFHFLDKLQHRGEEASTPRREDDEGGARVIRVGTPLRITAFHNFVEKLTRGLSGDSCAFSEHSNSRPFRVEVRQELRKRRRKIVEPTRS